MDSEEAASYSLEQLQQIATEVGISSEAVVAAAEQARTSGSRRRWLRLAILIAVGVALLGFLLPATGLAPLLIALIGVVFGLILLFFLLGLVPL